MRDPKAIRKAIMTAKSVARLIDPHFGRVPLPELGDFGRDEPVQEHSPLIHDIYHEPMSEHFARGGLPTLKPAIRHKGKVYSSVVDHLSALSGIEDPEEYRNARMDGENRGYVDERGRYLDRYRAQGYAKAHGLIRQDAPEWAHNTPELISENLMRYPDQEERNQKILSGEGYAAGGDVGDDRQSNLSAFLEGNHPLVPDVVYHGTDRDISEFDTERPRRVDAGSGGTDTGWYSKGHYFTPHKNAANRFASDYHIGEDNGPNVMPVHLSLKNPFIVKVPRSSSGATEMDRAMDAAGFPKTSDQRLINKGRGERLPSEQTKMLMDAGHDGVIVMHQYGIKDRDEERAAEAREQEAWEKHQAAKNAFYEMPFEDAENAHLIKPIKDEFIRTRREYHAAKEAAGGEYHPHELVVFKPHQIKSAIGNIGQYNPHESDITKASGGDVEGRELNDFGLYSHAAEQAGTLARQDSPENYRDMLLKRGVKPAELKWSGYDEAFAGQPQISREDLVQHFRNNMPDLYESQFGTDPHEKQRKEMAQRHLQEATQLKLDKLGSLHIPYHEDPDFIEMTKRHKEEIESLPPSQFGRAAHHERWTLPGGENYREIAVQHNSFGGFPGVEQHFDKEPDIIASLRMKDRNDHEGDRVLHLDELQSDWGQNARKYGFKDTLRLKEAMRELEAANVAYAKGFESGDDSERDAAIKRHKEAQKAVISARNAVNDAAYIGKTDDWVDLGLKRALLEAAKGGYDKLAWTPGQEQADRYDLSQHIKEIHHENNDDGTYNLIAYGHDGEKVYDEDDIPEEKLEGLLGKEMTQKVLSGEGKERDDAPYRDWRILSGLDLKVGGEGMKKFYDEMLPKRLQKLARMHDPEAKFTHSVVPVRKGDEFGENIRDESYQLPAIEITPKMRESILKRGFPAYAEGGEVDGHTVDNPMSIFPKPQRMWDEDMPGGAYLSMPHQEDVTGHKASSASIGIQEGGKPYFHASRDAAEVTGSPGRGSATVKTNLFKQKAGWKWLDAPEGHENTNTLVSVEHRGKHHYVLHAHFPKGVDLARYPDAPSEPRLRPTTKGNVELGPQVGSISVRGKEHPVHAHAIVKAYGGEVGKYARGGKNALPEHTWNHLAHLLHSLEVGRDAPLPVDPTKFKKYLQQAQMALASPITIKGSSVVEKNPGAKNLKMGKFSKDIADMSSTVREKGTLMPYEEADLEKMQREGASIAPFLGDLSAAGRYLTHVGNVKLTEPSEQQGGAEFMRSEFARGAEPAAYGNRTTAARTLARKIVEQAEKGRPIIGTHVAMGVGSIDSSHHAYEPIIRMIPNMDIKDQHIDEFDDLVRKTFPPSKRFPMEWPGILNTRKAEQFFANRPGTHASTFVDLLDRRKWQDAGFPDVGEVRFAASDPRLLGHPRLSTGAAFSEVEPTEEVVEKPDLLHTTYPTLIKTTKGKGYRGGASIPIPARLMFSDFYKTLKTVNRSGAPIDYESPAGATLAQQSLMTKVPVQKATQEWLDNIMEDRRQKEERGFRKGGSIRKALMIAKSSKKK